MSAKKKPIARNDVGGARPRRAGVGPRRRQDPRALGQRAAAARGRRQDRGRRERRAADRRLPDEREARLRRAEIWLTGHPRHRRGARRPARRRDPREHLHGRGLAAAVGGTLSVLVGGGRHRAARRRRRRATARSACTSSRARSWPPTGRARSPTPPRRPSRPRSPAAVLFSGSARRPRRRRRLRGPPRRRRASSTSPASRLADGGFVATHPCFGGSVIAQMQVTAGPTIVTVRPSSFAREEAPAEPEVVPLDASTSAPPACWPGSLDVVCENAGIVSLEEASIIVSGGRGVGSAESFAVDPGARRRARRGGRRQPRRRSTPAGSTTSTRSARPARPSRPSSTSPAASPAPSSTAPACRARSTSSPSTRTPRRPSSPSPTSAWSATCSPSCRR